MRVLHSMTLFAFLAVAISCSKKQEEVPQSLNNGSLLAEADSDVDLPLLRSDSSLVSKTLFKSGDEGYAFFRIPALLKAKDSTVLAFAEGRRKNMSDFGQIDIVLRRSIDAGKTWEPLKVVARNGVLQTDDPVPVMDYSDPAYPKGRVFLFYCTGNKPEASVIQLDGVKEVWYITSTNNGDTWSAPTNITLQVHHPYQPGYNPQYRDPLLWGYYATGPGHGLQLTSGKNKGRLIVPINHSIYRKGNYSTFFYSDDHGKTFQLAPDVPMESGEVTAAELNNGGLLLNSRNQYIPNKRNRILSYNRSGDFSAGSASWQTDFNSFLIEPVCEGSMLNFTNASKQKVLLFSNPNSTIRREKVSVKQSFDEGTTWSQGYLIDSTASASAYSDITVLPKRKIGILYEAENYNAIKFCSFDYRLIPKN